MLTDLHVHLRPDDEDASPERFFTAENAQRYRATATARGIQHLGVSEHVYRFRQALDIWRHPFWERYAVDDLDEYCDWVRNGTDLLLGIEADWLAGRENGIARFLEGRDWDYVIGSVHFVRDEAVDVDEWGIWKPGADPDDVWARYFDALAEAARSGLFDVLAHPDLVKVWGDPARVPNRDLRFYYDAAMDGIADSDVAIEVSTAGLRKPAGEIYPAPDFLRMCVDAGKPVALSSDAHRPEDLGHRYSDAIDLLRSLGVDEIAVFEGRERRMVPLG